MEAAVAMPCPWEGATAELSGLVNNLNLGGGRRGRLPDNAGGHAGQGDTLGGGPARNPAAQFQRSSGGAGPGAGQPDFYAAAGPKQHLGPPHGYPSSLARLGWGGQAIPDSSGFKAPWFGRSRGRDGGGGPPNGGRNRGRQQGGGNRRPSRPAWSSSGRADGGPGGPGGDGITVEHLVHLVSSIPAGQRIGDGIYQALFQFDGRSCALLIKDLAKAGMQSRATELFDWLRVLEEGHPLRSLLDVYSYTAAISHCINEQAWERALALAAEMKARGVECNVHTYTALMNVCIKCSRYTQALETYRLMRAEGCPANVVTYNTLIDAYGKTGAWERAVEVLALMRSEGVEPVLRTYNTLIIACNMCAQPREAMAVYRIMLEEGLHPNSTTYNALISAYGKAGQLDKVMEVFQEMMANGCERSVITYSSLISACEKAGQWELALELFKEMCREQCSPNTVTFNSLITALAQGAQWKKASEMFEQMQSWGCRPDVVTYTALISALEKGGQWQLALRAFERMRSQGCKGDAIVYNAIIDALWGTGVVWAQRRALVLFRLAVEEGHFCQTILLPGLARAEVNLHAVTAGVAMLSLYAWLMSLKALVVHHGAGAAPACLGLVTDKGRGAKEQGNLVVKEAVQAAMHQWGAPFRSAGDAGYADLLEASGPDVAEWLLSDAFEAQLFYFFPCTDIMPAPGGNALLLAQLDDFDHGKEASVEQRCGEAFAAVRHFEKTHCLSLPNMGFAYLQRRNELVASCLDVTQRLGIKEEAGHDAVLLMDRVMSTKLALQPDLLDLLAAACVAIASKQVDGHSSAMASRVPDAADIEEVTGLPTTAVQQMEWSIRQVLEQDTAAISTLRCLKLFLERLGGQHLPVDAASALVGRMQSLVVETLTDMAFLNCRPSVIAAAVLYVERRACGIIPFWPSMLAKLTGYQDMSTAELSVAIKAAQRMSGRIQAAMRTMLCARASTAPALHAVPHTLSPTTVGPSAAAHMGLPRVTSAEHVLHALRQHTALPRNLSSNELSGAFSAA